MQFSQIFKMNWEKKTPVLFFPSFSRWKWQFFFFTEFLKCLRNGEKVEKKRHFLQSKPIEMFKCGKIVKIMSIFIGKGNEIVE